MTVCIAALCDGGKSCVVATDKMVVQLQGPTLDLETKIDNQQGKICRLSSCSVLLHSGTRKDAEAIITAANGLLAKGSPSVREAVVKGIESVVKNNRDREVARALGPTFDFDTLVGTIAKLSAGPLCDLWQQLRKVDCGASLLVSPKDGGFEIWCFDPPYCDGQPDTPYAALGTGATLARTALTIQRYNKDLVVMEALFEVYSAKKVTELRSYGVGEATDMAVLTKDGLGDMTAETLALLEKYRVERLRLADEQLSALQKSTGL